MVFALTGSLCEKFLSVSAEFIYPICWQWCGFLSVTWTFADSFSGKLCTWDSQRGNLCLLSILKTSSSLSEISDCNLTSSFLSQSPTVNILPEILWATESLLHSRKDWLRITSEVMRSLCLDMPHNRGSMLRGCHDKCLKNFIIEFKWVQWENVVLLEA